VGRRVQSPVPDILPLLTGVIGARRPRSSESLRPKQLAEYVGQRKIVDNLRVFIQAARAAARRSTTCCCSGRRGSARPRSPTSSRTRWAPTCAPPPGPVLERAGDLAAILTNLEPGEVLFIDEIHRLGRHGGGDPLPGHRGLPARSHDRPGTGGALVKLELPRFTLVGATTRAGLITAPLRARFGIVHRLDFYSPEELPASSPARRACSHADRRRGRPRDRPPQPRHAAYRQPPAAPRARLRPGRGDGVIDGAHGARALDLLEVDEHGFDEVDRKILTTLIEHYHGGPAGIKALAAAIGEDRGTSRTSTSRSSSRRASCSAPARPHRHRVYRRTARDPHRGR
jgi:holliday junction DNA helicase RuvB